MIRNIIILAVLLGAGFAYTYYDDDSRQRVVTAEEPEIAAALQSAPDFSFQSLSGEKHTLFGFKGKAVILNFWASWCAPCLIEFPQMLTLAKNNEDAAFIFLSLDDDQAAMDRFIKKLGKNAKLSNVYIGRDKDKAVSESYETYKLPETYLITPNGMISQKIIGNSVEWNGAEISKTITDLSTLR